MAQLVEWSLPTPVVRGSNPGLSKFYIPTVDENQKKPGMGQINTCYIKMALVDVEYTYQCQRFETYGKCYTIMTSCKFVYLMQSQSASTFSFFLSQVIIISDALLFYRLHCCQFETNSKKSF